LGEKLGSLAALAYACTIYQAMTGFDDSLGTFQSQTENQLDLGDPNHRSALLKWLNAWGCRNLALACHADVSQELAGWYTAAANQLPDFRARLVTMKDTELDECITLFDDLSTLPAREGVKNGRRFPISFGPTPASKTLFALRPEVFVPWDEAIRQRLVTDDSGQSYVDFLKYIRSDLKAIKKQCEARDLNFRALPARLGRDKATLPKLVGEYYWITITRKVKIPDRSTLEDWLSWS
jgi:hypothetical protein